MNIFKKHSSFAFDLISFFFNLNFGYQIAAPFELKKFQGNFSPGSFFLRGAMSE